jgi:hypothetical protein
VSNSSTAYSSPRFAHWKRARRCADREAGATLASNPQGVRPDEETGRRVFRSLLAELDGLVEVARLEFRLRDELERVRFVPQYCGQIVYPDVLTLHEAEVE